MFRQIGWGAAAVLTAGALAVGCGSDGDTNIQGGSVQFPGAFPGSTVDENFVGSDGLAFTNPYVQTAPDNNGGGGGIGDPVPGRENNIGQPRMYWNRANGQGIMLYGVRNEDDQSEWMLMASYYDGQGFNTPVQIRGNGGGAVEDPGARPVGFKVLWINTSSHPDQIARAKNGDAIILFTRNDLDLTPSVAGSNEDSNRRAWFSYLNVSEASADTSGGFTRGFLADAIAIDPDLIGTGQDNNVETFGFISDALVGTHEFTGETDAVDSGDETTYVTIVYGKDTNTGATPSPRFRRLDLDLTSPDLPTAAATDLALGQGTYDAGEGADITSPVIVHNNFAFWQSTGVGNGSGDDTVTTVTIMQEDSPGGVGSAQTLNETLTTNSDFAFLPSAANVYGPDHGLSKVAVFHLASGYSAGAAGDRNPNQDVMLVTFSTDSTTAPTIERQEIDPFTSVLSATVTAGIGVMDSVETRISRPGTWILALMVGDNSEDTAIVNFNNRLYARGFQPQLEGAAVNRALANALTAVLTVPSLTGSTTQGQADVAAVRFQENLAFGQATAQARELRFDTTNGQFSVGDGNTTEAPEYAIEAGSDRGCSFQGNPDRMNFLYQQLNDQSNGTTSDEVRLLVNGVTIDRDAVETVPPVLALTSGTEVVIETVDTGYLGLNTIEAAAFDAGDATTSGQPAVPTASAGRVIVFFVSNDNNKLDNGAVGSFLEQRLYAWENGAVTTVSTNPSTTTLQLFQVVSQGADLGGFLGGTTVPVNENTSQSPTAVGTTLHVWWQELESIGGNNGRVAANLGTRSYNLTQTAASTAVALADRFTPPTTDDPVFIDHQTGGQLFGDNYGGDDLIDSQFHMVRDGSTVGVYFDEENRIWYQQTSDDAEGYYQDQGVATPELVDHENGQIILRRFHVITTPECDNASGTVIYWEKRLDPFQQNHRGQVRIAD